MCAGSPAWSQLWHTLGATVPPCPCPRSGRLLVGTGTKAGVSVLLQAQGAFLPVLLSLMPSTTPTPSLEHPSPQGEFGPMSLKSPSCRPASQRITLPSDGLSPAEWGWGRGSGAPHPAVPDMDTRSTEPSLGCGERSPALTPWHLLGAVGHGTSRSRIHPSRGAATAAEEPCSASHGHHRPPAPRPSPTPAPGEASGTHGTGVPPRLPPAQLPLPACTVRRRRRKAAAAQPQRRAATGRLPVSLAMASQAHLPGFGAARACGARLAFM